ncbi:MAG: YkgJ family cysteine cluster protein [Planctomycetota bacterium]
MSAPDPVAGAQGESREWYADGLRFECTMCGNCCTGPPGAVWFGDEEAQRMADKLGLGEKAFRKRFARRIGRRWSLNEQQTKHGFDCVFLDRSSVEGKAVCRLYEARPDQCRTWPFWPENVATPEAWDAAKRDTPCPGMGSGRLVAVEEIRISAKPA